MMASMRTPICSTYVRLFSGAFKFDQCFGFVWLLNNSARRTFRPFWSYEIHWYERWHVGICENKSFGWKAAIITARNDSLASSLARSHLTDYPHVLQTCICSFWLFFSFADQYWNFELNGRTTQPDIVRSFGSVTTMTSIEFFKKFFLKILLQLALVSLIVSGKSNTNKIRILCTFCAHTTTMTTRCQHLITSRFASAATKAGKCDCQFKRVSCHVIILIAGSSPS